MSRLHRRLIALLTIPLLILMSGCMRMKADYEILSADEVRIAMDVGMQNETLEQMGEEVPDFCEQAGTMDVGAIAQEEYTEDGPDGYTGCRITGTAPISELNDGSTSLTLDDGTWTFHMEGDDSGEAEGMTAEMFSDFEIRVTFPGEVLSHNGASTLEGSTVIWASPADLFTSEGLVATAEDGGVAALPWLWIAVGAAVIVGIIVALVLVLGRKRDTAASQEGSPFQGGDGQPYPPQGQNPAGQPYPPQNPQQPYPPQDYPQQQPYPPQDYPQQQPFPPQGHNPDPGQR